MKFLPLILLISLITFSQSTVSGVEFDLKSGQSVATGSNVAVSITITVSGATGDSEAFKTGTFTLVKSDDTSTTATLTCNLATAVTVNYGTPGEASCTIATLSTAGTYKLSAVTAATTDGSTSNTNPSVKSNGSTLSVTTKTTTADSSSSNSSDDDDDSSKFLNSFSSFLFLILFF